MYKYEIEINNKYQNFNFTEQYNQFSSLFVDENIILSLITACFRETLAYGARPSFDKYYKFTSKGLIKIGGGFCSRENYGLEEEIIPMALSTVNSCGLYFIGQIGITPEGKKYYLVKIGSAIGRTIAQRVADYAGYNPMIYHNNCALTTCPKGKTWEQAENACHQFLAKQAIKKAQKTNEWFYVPEEIYFQLCDLFANEEFFYEIANGEG